MKINGFSISEGNKKMGLIPSFSVTPVKTCACGVPCTKDCYAVKMCHRFKNTATAYENNYQLLLSENGYSLLHKTVNMYLFIRPVRYFRWNVAGDIFEWGYMDTIDKIAKDNPDVTFLVYTKQYELVNQYYTIGRPPKNLRIIYSNWKEWQCENPHNFPVAEYAEKGDDVAEGFVCGGNCAECRYCYNMQPGQKVVFYKH